MEAARNTEGREGCRSEDVKDAEERKEPQEAKDNIDEKAPARVEVNKRPAQGEATATICR